MSALEVLHEAQSLIYTPRRWLQESMARNIADFPVDPWDETASYFCAFGAIQRAGGCSPHNTMTDDSRKALGILKNIIHNSSIVAWNDDENTTHSVVMDAFDKAIAFAEANGL